jgi:hypothetical protein
MVRRAVSLFVVGAAIGVAADRLAAELRKPAADQFPWLRQRMNEDVNPWLIAHGVPGSANAEIATLEHIGRTSGLARFTPVHPTIRGETVLIPVPLGSGSQWARNVVAAGRARLQLHEVLYDLDAPELIPVAETGLYPSSVAGPFDRMGWRYLRLHVARTVPGTFAVHASAVRTDMPLHEDVPLDMPFTIPVDAEVPAGMGVG